MNDRYDSDPTWSTEPPTPATPHVPETPSAPQAPYAPDGPYAPEGPYASDTPHASDRKAGEGQVHAGDDAFRVLGDQHQPLGRLEHAARVHHVERRSADQHDHQHEQRGGLQRQVRHRGRGRRGLGWLRRFAHVSAGVPTQRRDRVLPTSAIR